MDRKLTIEFSETVGLSLNPFRRHAEVLGMIADPDIVGGDIQVHINSPRGEVGGYEPGKAILVHTISPFLGRRALKVVAQTLEHVDKMDRGEE